MCRSTVRDRAARQPRERGSCCHRCRQRDVTVMESIRQVPLLALFRACSVSDGSGRPPRVPVMQATDHGQLDHFAHLRSLHITPGGRVLAQGQVRPARMVVIVEIALQETAEDLYGESAARLEEGQTGQEQGAEEVEQDRARLPGPGRTSMSSR